MAKSELFLSTPSARRATRRAFLWCAGTFQFLSTPSARRATAGRKGVLPCLLISIHALREEGDTLPVPSDSRFHRISIHALREEGDFVLHGIFCGICKISIHALREEGDWQLSATKCRIFRFLSTPSARRATADMDERVRWLEISIHALREEGDFGTKPAASHMRYFYPRPPRGGRPLRWNKDARRYTISIHALREEGDWKKKRARACLTNFYPRPPRGGRHAADVGLHGISEFLSTPSARRATDKAQGFFQCHFISIHALREEGDQVLDFVKFNKIDFYPRPPRGGRHFGQICLLLPCHDFYPRPPRGGRPGRCFPADYGEAISIHALREEGD